VIAAGKFRISQGQKITMIDVGLEFQCARYQ
jgi:hypothetical protein